MNVVIVPAIFLIFIIILIVKCFKVVPQSKAFVVFQLGRLTKVCGPGLHLVLPFVEKGQFVDLGRQTVELKSQQIPISDSSPVNTTSIIGFRITDPSKAIMNIADYKSALTTLSETHLRRCCSEITLTELLTDRPRLQERIRESVNNDSLKFGIQVDDFVIKFVDVPEEVQNELRRKTETERLRRLMSES